MASATTKKVGQTASLIMGGITKIHVGELIGPFPCLVFMISMTFQFHFYLFIFM